MGLETGNYIPELDENNPLGGDAVSQGDDHLRLIKRAIINSFSGFEGSSATPKSVTLTEDQINDAALQAADAIITGEWTFQNQINIVNNKGFNFESSTVPGNLINILNTDSTDRILVGAPETEPSTSLLLLRGDEDIFMQVDGTVVAAFKPQGEGSLNVRDRKGVTRSVGYLGSYREPLPNADYTPTDENAGHSLDMTPSVARTVTLNQLSNNVVMRFFNNANGVPIRFAPGAGVSIYIYSGEGERIGPGSVDLNGGGVCEVYWATTGIVRIFGAGLSLV